MKPLALCLFLTLIGGILPSQGAYYQAGQVVTNFVVYARPGASPFPEDSPVRLRDFSGKILFVEFFDPT